MASSISYGSSPSLGGISRAASKTAGPARGAAAINAAAREKTAAAQAARAQTTATDNNVANVTPIAGPNPIRQPAYETQAQTLLEQNFQGEQAGLGRAHQTTQQQNEAAARLKEQEAAAAAQRGEMELAARLSAEADKRRMGQISVLSRQMTGGGGDVPNQGPDPQEEQARQAAFARAKERAGMTALSGINSLKSIMEASGKMGSSMESQGMAEVIGGGVSDINDFTRDELIMDTGRAADIADRNYAGALTKRGQDMSMNQSLLSLMKGGVY